MTDNIPQGWRKVKLGDVCSSISNTYRRKDEYVVLINTSDVLDGKVLNHKAIKNENLKGQFKKTFQKNDILYSEIRPANKRFAFIDFEPTINYIASTKLMVIRPDTQKVLPNFLYTILKAPLLLDELQRLAETRSGTFPQITFNAEVAPYEIDLPPMEVQKKIAGVLSCLDDKIELNNKINQNLEQQAQALFKSWFVDFEPFGGTMPSDWKMGKLEDIANIIMGQSPEGTSYNEKGNGIIFFQGRAEFGTRFPSPRLYTSEPKKIADKEDILMSVRAPVGDLNIANKKCCIGRGLCAIRSINKYQSFIFYTLQNLKRKLEMYNSEGTVFGAINNKDIKSLEVIIPCEDFIKKFQDIVSKLDAQICLNFEQNERLAEIRDTLRPKLMSGELNVDNVNIDEL